MYTGFPYIVVRYGLFDRKGWDKMRKEQIETLSTVRLQHNPELYKIVDSLNRTLKDDDLMFGLALDEVDNETAVFTIYRT